MASPFHSKLSDQISHEFTAAQQYISIAVHFDSNKLPQLAHRFYTQAREERGHALMMVQYLLDRDVQVHVGGLGEVVSTFDSMRAPLELALQQERDVTDKIAELSRTARESGDYLGERFMQWFLSAQVDEIASMTTLLTVFERAAGNLFDVEEFLARESRGGATADPTAPKMAGGGV